MAHLLLEPIDWSPLLQHERRVRVSGLHQRPIRNVGSLYQPRPQRLRHPVHIQCFPSPVWEDEFAPQFHAVSLLEQFLANTRQHLDVTKAGLLFSEFSPGRVRLRLTRMRSRSKKTPDQRSPRTSPRRIPVKKQTARSERSHPSDAFRRLSTSSSVNGLTSSSFSSFLKGRTSISSLSFVNPRRLARRRAGRPHQGSYSCVGYSAALCSVFACPQSPLSRD